MIQYTTWHDQYRDSWQGLLVSDAPLTLRCTACRKRWQAPEVDLTLPCPHCKAVGTAEQAQLDLFTSGAPLSAFQHPAKVSRSLARRIYEHLRESYGLMPGSKIIDPFLGVGGLALDAYLSGYHFIGIEIEKKFHTLAQANLTYWRHKFGPQPGSVTFLQGDSRHLASILREAGCLVSSPPYANGLGKEDTYADQAKREKDAHRRVMREKHIADPYYGDAPAQLGNLSPGSLDACLASPPFSDCDTRPTKLGSGRPTRADGDSAGRNKGDYHYGETPGNVGHLETGSLDTVLRKNSLTYVSPGYETLGQFAGLASSPPYAGAGEVLGAHNGIDYAKCSGSGQRATPTRVASGLGYGARAGQLARLKMDALVSSPPYADQAVGACEGNMGGGPGGRKASAETTVSGNLKRVGYGDAPGQLARLKMDALVSSMPYEAQASNCATNHGKEARPHWKAGGIAAREPHLAPGYGDAPGQLGNATRETFWDASLTILRQCYDVLAPGALAVWICKSFIRDGQIVDFPADWQRAAESVGFETLEIIEALQVERWSEATLGGGEKGYKKSHKGFFRNLCENRGAPPIDAEIVLIQRKPLSGAPR